LVFTAEALRGRGFSFFKYHEFVFIRQIRVNSWMVFAMRNRNYFIFDLSFFLTLKQKNICHQPAAKCQ